MDVGSFFRKWLRDLAADQLPGGGVPFVIPDVLTAMAHLEPTLKGTDSSTGWGDAAVICPWTMYCRYRDERLLAEQYPSMKAWVERIRSVAEGGTLWNSGFHFGDWVALDAKEGSYFGATPNDFTATAFYAYSVELTAKAASVLGKTEEAAVYSDLHGRIVAAFRSEFVTPSGRLASRTQTAHILALVFGLLQEKDRSRAVSDLAALITENGGHLTTGFLGTPFILRALAENGRLDLAYDLLLKEDYPSWLYQITRGATTVWEHWDGLKPNGTMWSADMNSFNHYAYGAVGQWMYETIAGLAPDPEIPGFKSFILAPRPGGGIDRCRVSYRGPYGEIRSEWRIEGGRFVMEATVPPNSSARVVLRGVSAASVTASFVPAPAAQARIVPMTEDEGTAAMAVGSGRYRIEYAIT
jgi:alpha-L-rhamnosidase